MVNPISGSGSEAGDSIEQVVANSRENPPLSIRSSNVYLEALDAPPPYATVVDMSSVGTGELSVEETSDQRSRRSSIESSIRPESSVSQWQERRLNTDQAPAQGAFSDNPNQIPRSDAPLDSSNQVSSNVRTQSGGVNGKLFGLGGGLVTLGIVGACLKGDYSMPAALLLVAGGFAIKSSFKTGNAENQSAPQVVQAPQSRHGR